METKECKQCKMQINKSAKKCPYCQSDQRNFFQRNPVLSILFIMVGLGMVSALTFEPTTPEVPETYERKHRPVTEEHATALQNNLVKYWAEGRWDEVRVKLEDGGVVVRIDASPLANDVALEGYCKVLVETSNQHIPVGNSISISIYQSGELVKTCK